MMESFTEYSDEDCLDDPITLIDCEQKRINMINIQESILISDSDVDAETVPSPQPAKSAMLPKYARASSCKIVNSNLPEAFQKQSRNIQLLNKCLPLRIKVVDCINHSWYYRKKYKNIKFEESVNKLRTINKREYKISVEGRNLKDTMKLKIRAVDIETYLKSPIRDIKTAQCRQNNDEGALKKGNDEKSVQFRNIDFKKNRGLVGLKIVYDGNITDSNPFCEGNKQSNEAKMPRCSSQNMENKSVGTFRSPENSGKKRDIEECPSLVDPSRPMHLKKNKHGEFYLTSNSDSLKFTNGSKAAEEKHYHDKRSSQTHDLVASKRDISKKKLSEQRTKPKTSGKKQKVLKETKEVENAKMDQEKHAYVKKTEKFTVQNNEMKATHGENRMAENVSKSKVLGHTLDVVFNNESKLKISVEDNTPLSIITKDKVKPGKHKITKLIQQNIGERCEQRQNNPKSNNAIGQTMDINEAASKNKIALKMNVEYNLPVSNLTKSGIKLVKKKAMEKLQQNNDRRCEKQKIKKNIEKSTRINLGQNVNKGGNIKTESKLVSLNEGYNNTSYKRNQIPSKVANSQLNHKLALQTPDLSKQEKNCESQQKQALSIKKFSIGKSEHPQLKRALALTKREVICPVSNINSVAENSRSTSSPAAQEKQSLYNEKLMSPHNELQVTVPTSFHQMLPSSNQSRIQYQVSPNVPMSKVLSRSFSQPSQNKNLIPTPLRISKRPSILSHARIIIKRPNSEPVSNPEQQLSEKQNGQNNSTPNKTLNLIPTLTSMSKGRYLLINKKITDSSKVREQHTDSISFNFEQHHLHAMPIQHNQVIQNKYSMPDMSNNTNNLALKEKSENKRPVLNPPSSRHKQNSTLYPNLQPQQPTVPNQNHNNLRVQHPNLPPLPNLYLSNYVQNPPLNTDQTHYFNDQSQLNKNLVLLSSQHQKPIEHRSFYNNDAILKTEPSAKTVQPALPTWQNKHESFYNHSSCQATAYQQQELNEHATWSHQNTITNLDTNALMYTPPLYDYGLQNMDDMDCAYWKDVNYLGDRWQEGYPQPEESQQLPTVFQHQLGLPQFQHPPSLLVSQYPLVPSDFQHPPPLPISTYKPPPSSISQQSLPPSVAQNPVSSAALEYPPLTPVIQHPPPVGTQHPPPPLSHPHPPLLTTSTQGCTILGANNNGVVRTINLVTSTTTGSEVATLNNSLIAKNNNPENSKTGMLKGLSKITGAKSENLKIPISDSHSELNKFINRNPSDPLAKVKKIEGFATCPSLSQKLQNYGYSSPILPIFTYEKSLEYISQVSKALDNFNGEKSDLDGCEDRDKALIKNSIDEYKYRSQEETVEDIQAKLNSEKNE